MAKVLDGLSAVYLLSHPDSDALPVCAAMHCIMETHVSYVFGVYNMKVWACNLTGEPANKLLYPNRRTERKREIDSNV